MPPLAPLHWLLLGSTRSLMHSVCIQCFAQGCLDVTCYMILGTHINLPAACLWKGKVKP